MVDTPSLALYDPTSPRCGIRGLHIEASWQGEFLPSSHRLVSSWLNFKLRSRW